MAELNAFVRDLEKELTCSICNDIFTEPKTLQCLHSFCFNCIAKWNETCRNQRKRLTCPTCRAPVDVQGGDVSKLPSSFSFNSLLQLFNVMGRKAEEQNQRELPLCVSCAKNVMLVAFCSQCGGIVCEDCVNAHKTLKALQRDHQVTMLSEFNQEHLNSYINNQAFCKEKFHEKNKLEYYCKTCLKSICQKCAATIHSTHEKVGVEEAAEDAKKVIRRDMNRLNPLKERYKRELQLSKQNMSRFENEINAAKKKVDDETEAQKKILQDHHNATMRTLDEMLHKHRTTNDEEQTY